MSDARIPVHQIAGALTQRRDHPFLNLDWVVNQRWVELRLGLKVPRQIPRDDIGSGQSNATIVAISWRHSFAVS